MKANAPVNTHIALHLIPRRRLLLLLHFLFTFGIFSQISSPAQSPAQSDANRLQTQQRLSVMQSKAAPNKDRLNALHQTFAAKESLSSTEQVEFMDATTAIAKDNRENSRLRADSIRIAGDVGMAIVHDKALSPELVAQRCSFLLGLAADQNEPAQIRHNSIIALGNLRMVEAVPVVRKVLEDKANYNRPEITRSACLVMAELGASDAVQSIGMVLSQTTNLSVFGSAAYALGRANSAAALPVLLANRSRLGDNLSVDNAVEAMQEHVFKALERPNPQMLDAIKATKSLWREEQKLKYTPLLLEIVKSQHFTFDARREALSRLLDDATTVPLEEEKLRLSAILPLVETDEAFKDEVASIHQKLNARVLTPTSVEPPPAK